MTTISISRHAAHSADDDVASPRKAEAPTFHHHHESSRASAKDGQRQFDRLTSSMFILAATAADAASPAFGVGQAEVAVASQFVWGSRPARISSARHIMPSELVPDWLASRRIAASMPRISRYSLVRSGRAACRTRHTGFSCVSSEPRRRGVGSPYMRCNTMIVLSCRAMACSPQSHTAGSTRVAGSEASAIL